MSPPLRSRAAPAQETDEAAWDEALHPILTPALRARIKRLELRTRRRMSSALSGAYRSTFRGSGIEFEEVRPYLPGDDVRSIDWRVTARTGEPHLKTYREERQLRVQLLVDASPSMDFGTREATKREKAAELCAVLCAAAAQSKDMVGLHLFADRPGKHLPFAVGSSQTLRVLRAVMGEQGGADRGPGLVEAIETTERTLRRHALLFVVSDFAGLGDTPWWTPLSRLARRHDVVCARVTDPFERELPRIGLVRLADAESGRTVELDTSSARVRRAWAARAEQRRDAFLEGVSRGRAVPLELDTVTSSADPLLALFQRRGRGGGR